MKCEYCNTEFQSKSALNNHKNKAKYCLILQGKIEPKNEIFKCNLCEKILSTKQYLELHKQKCEGKKEKIEEEFKCNLCEKILSSKQMLELHKQKCEGKKEKKEEFKCEYCEKILSSKQNLEIHMKKCEIIEEKEEFKCEYCDKILSTKQILENHKNICSIKKEKEKEQIYKELKELKEQLESKDKDHKKQLESKDKDHKKQLESKDKDHKKQLESKDKELKEQLESKDKKLKEKDSFIIKLKTQNENLEKQEENYKDQIKDLQCKLENLASKAIDRPTSIVANTTTNNSLNIATSIDFDNIEHIKNLIDNYLTINHVVDGQKGIANFVRETMLIDDNGIPKYICTDQSRNIFKYKDTNGEIKKDVEAKKLTGSLVKGGIRKQTALLGNEWVQNEENSNNYLHKLEIMMEFQENIHKLGDNNTDFRKELATITS